MRIEDIPAEDRVDLVYVCVSEKPDRVSPREATYLLYVPGMEINVADYKAPGNQEYLSVTVSHVAIDGSANALARAMRYHQGSLWSHVAFAKDPIFPKRKIHVNELPKIAIPPPPAPAVAVLAD